LAHRRIGQETGGEPEEIVAAIGQTIQRATSRLTF
jgi:hypothetical protein